MQVHKEEKMTQKTIFIQKRDGRKQDFDVQKITQALFQATQQLDQKYSLEEAREMAFEVESKVDNLTEEVRGNLTTTNIDEVVLEVLEQKGYPLLAQAYIHRREEKAKGRKDRRDVTIAVIGAFLIQNYEESAIVTFLFLFGSWLEARTLNST